MPFSLSEIKNGITDPREPITFPYRTTEKSVLFSRSKSLPATKSLSDTSFVAP